MIKLTLALLRRQGACGRALDWLEEVLDGRKELPLSEALRLVLANDDYAWIESFVSSNSRLLQARVPKPISDAVGFQLDESFEAGATSLEDLALAISYDNGANPRAGELFVDYLEQLEAAEKKAKKPAKKKAKPAVRLPQRVVINFRSRSEWLLVAAKIERTMPSRKWAAGEAPSRFWSAGLVAVELFRGTTGICTSRRDTHGHDAHDLLALSDKDFVATLVAGPKMQNRVITLKWLIERGACRKGLLWFLGQYGSGGVYELALVESFPRGQKQSWTDWLACH